MEFDKLIADTHAVRAFTDKQVPVKDLEEIIAQAINAPTWSNAQERHVYIATGETAKAIEAESLELSMKQTPANSSYPLGHHSDWSPMAQENMANFEKMVTAATGGNMEAVLMAQGALFNAPALIYLTLPQNPAPWALLDLGAFEEAIVLCASNKGVGSVVAYSAVRYPDVVRKHLQIPADEDVVIGIAAGYADEANPITRMHGGRRPVEDILVIR